MLYELLTGIRPFRGERMDQLMKAILMDYPDPDLEVLRPDIQVALVDLIYRMLEKNVQSRIPSMRVIGAELEAISQGRTLYFTESHVSDHDLLSETMEPADISEFLKPPQHNLPANLNDFVGREAEIETLSHALTEQRLISIVAAGGMGKTRLALEIGWQQVEQWQHGVFFVDLAPLTDPDDILATIAQAIGYQFHDDTPPHEQLMHYLRNKHMLLVMDNFEHLLDGAALVDDTLAAAPDVVILATSRERLALPLETIFTISGMGFPNWETPEDALRYSAAQLFMQSARRINPTFDLEHDDLKYLVRICRLVDGMPLGIILAASWIDILTLPEIAEEISRSADFLESDSRGMPDRHRSIRAVFDSSWQRLTALEQAAFAKLSIFRGGFTREAAQTITGTDLRTLTRLVHKSLLQRSNDGRFAIHELMRQYGEQALKSMPDRDALYDAHSAYYLEFLRLRERDFTNDRHAETLYETQLEYNNIQVAWQWAVENRASQRLIDCLWAMQRFHMMNNSSRQFEVLVKHAAQFFERHDRTIEQKMARAVLSLEWALLTEQSHSREIRFRTIQDLIQQVELSAFYQWRLALLKSELYPDYFSKTLAIAEKTGEDVAIGITCTRWVYLLSLDRNYEQAMSICKKAIHHFEMVPDYWGQSSASLRLANLYSISGDKVTARQMYLQVMRIGLKIHGNRLVAWALKDLAVLERLDGNLNQALYLYEQSWSHYKEFGNNLNKFSLLDEFSMLYYAMGDYERSRHYAEQCMEIVHQQAWLTWEIYMHNQMGFIDLAVGNFDDARQHFRASIKGHASVSDSHSYFVNTIIGIAHLLASDNDPTNAYRVAYFGYITPAVDKNKLAVERLVTELEAQLSREEIQRLRAEAEQLELVEVVRGQRAEFGNQGDE